MKIRRYFRQPTLQAATIKLPDEVDIPCEIVNFCQAGLFLKFMASDAGIRLPRSGSGIAAELVFTSSWTETTFRMAGRLTHAAAAGVGFVFDLPPPFEALLSLQEKALPPIQAEWKMSAELAEIHAHCLEALENALYPVLDKLPTQIGEDFAEEMQRVASKGLRYPQSAAFPLPEHQARPIVERFFAHTLEQAKSFVVPDLSLQPEAGVVYSGTESQRRMFEDWMNLIDKVIRLETQHGDVLKVLESRFTTLVRREIASHNDPFGPNVLCHSFHYSLQGVGLSNFHRNIVYQTFARLLGERLEKLYTELDVFSEPLDALAKASPRAGATSPNIFSAAAPLLPKARGPEGDHEALASLCKPENKPLPPLPQTPSPPVPRQLDISARPGQGNAFGLPGTPKASLVARQADAFSAFVVLSRYAESQAGKVYADEADALGDLERAALIAALLKLQTAGPGEPTPYFIAPKLQAGLGQILAETGQQDILANTEVRENLQTLGLLLDAMLNDPVLPSGAALYFRRLQIPLLIAAFTDPDVMHGKNHPVWEVFNQLDHLRRVANFQGELDNPQLVESLGKIFDRIRQEVATDPYVFVDALESLQKLTAPIIKAYATRLERIVESCEGGQRLEHARRLVNREIESRIGGKTVPAIVVSLLDAGWRQSLVLTVLRQGTDNDDWRQQWAALDLLLAWLDRSLASSMPSRTKIQELRNYILERLRNISAEPSLVEEILEKFDGLLPGDDSRPRLPGCVDIPAADTSKEQQEAALCDRLQGFRVGDWLRFALARRTWSPLCLAWIGQNPAHYVFVNSKGVKSLELDAGKFVQFLEDKRASRMDSPDELGLVERIAKSLLSTLRDRLR